MNWEIVEAVLQTDDFGYLEGWAVRQTNGEDRRAFCWISDEGALVSGGDQIDLESVLGELECNGYIVNAAGSWQINNERYTEDD